MNAEFRILGNTNGIMLYYNHGVIIIDGRIIFLQYLQNAIL